MHTEAVSDGRPIRILIVDDHPAVRQGLGLLLEPEGIMVCGEAGGHAEALASVEAYRPDLALVDLSLGDEDGLVVLADLRDRGLPCLVYSMHEDGRHVRNAFAAGAQGYVTKREVHGVLVEAISEVAAGRRFVSPRAAIALADLAASGRVDEESGELSNQEQEVYRFLGNGETTRQIASNMNISPRTVESYYERILGKLGLEGMRALRRHASSHKQRDSS